MKVDFLDLELMHKPIRTELDLAIKEVIDNSDFVKSKQVKAFEAQFEDYIGTKHIISCANGTDALEIALATFGIRAGDEVIVPAMSWISTSEVVVNTGAKPVFVDIDEKSFCIDTDKIQDAITSKTKAIIPVHLYGRPANMKKLLDLAKQHDLKLIEDCAQAHGASINDIKVGNFGDAATFSFFPTKNLGAFGDAGAIAFRHENDKKRALLIANHGQARRHVHTVHGRNSRMDGIQAAVLSVKLKKLDEWNNQRNELVRKYESNLKEVSSIVLPEVPDNELHVFHLYVIRAERRDDLKSFLSDKGIKTLIHYPTSLPFQPCYNQQGLTKEDFPTAYKCQQSILSLPFYPGMPEDKVIYVCNQIKEFYG